MQTVPAWTATAAICAAILAGCFLLYNERRKQKIEATKMYRDLERRVSWSLLTATHAAFRQKVGRHNNNVMTEASTESVVESWAQLVACASRDIVQAAYEYQKAFYDIPVIGSDKTSAPAVPALPVDEIARYRAARRDYIRVLRAHERVEPIDDIPSPSLPTEIMIGEAANNVTDE